MVGGDDAVVDLVATGTRPSEPRLILPAPGPGVLRVPVRVRDALFGDLCVTSKLDAREFDDDDRHCLAAHAGVAIGNATLHAEAEGSARRIEALREIAASLLAGRPLDELLELIASHAIRLVRGQMGNVLVPGARQGTLVIEAVAGQPRELQGMEVPLDHSLAGQVIRSGKTEVLANTSTDIRAFQPAAARGGQGPAMFVPLRARREPFGALLVTRGVGEPEVARRLKGAVGELDRVISDLRSYIFGLRPGVLAGRHVAQALRRLAEDIATAAGVTTVVEVDEQVAVALSHHAGELVQIVREALSNVGRHAHATTCRVSLYARQASPGAPPGRVAGPGGRRRRPRLRAGGQPRRPRPRQPARPRQRAGRHAGDGEPLRRRHHRQGADPAVAAAGPASERSRARRAQRPLEARRPAGTLSRGRPALRPVPLRPVPLRPTEVWDHPIMGSPLLRVMLVDDHEVVRSGIRALLAGTDDIAVTAEACSMREAVTVAERSAPDVVVMDVRLSDGSGIEATRDIRARRPVTKVLMLTSFADDEALFASIMAGAAGYVLKQIRGDELVRAIRTVGQGGNLLDPASPAASSSGCGATSSS